MGLIIIFVLRNTGQTDTTAIAKCTIGRVTKAQVSHTTAVPVQSAQSHPLPYAHHFPSPFTRALKREGKDTRA